MPDPGKPEPPSKPPPKAAAPTSKPSATTTAAAAKLSERLLAEMKSDAVAVAGPPGSQAAPGAFGAKLRKALPHLLTGLMELGAVAADGQLSADEAKALAGKLLEFIKGVREG